GVTIGPFLHTAVISVLGDETPYYSLSVWHGFTMPLLMSIIALLGGVILYFLIRNFARQIDGPPFVRHLKGQRIFERIMVTISWKMARSLENILGTRRLQAQIGVMMVTVLVAG